MRRPVIAATFLLSMLGTATVMATETPPPSEPAKQPKRLYTIPEDGLENSGTMRPNKFVRDLIESRPNELLTICVAGCYAERDRVIFAQPVEALAPPAPKASAEMSSTDTAPASDTASGEQSKLVPTAAPQAPAPAK